MNYYLDYILYQNFINHEGTERAELSHAIAESAMPLLRDSMRITKAVPGEPVEMEVTGTLPIAGYVAGYPVTQEMLQHLRWVNEYKAQGKRYPQPRRRRSKARMSKEWRNKV